MPDRPVIGIAIKLVEFLWRKWRAALCVLVAIVALWIAHSHLVHLAFNRAFNAGWQSLADKNAAKAARAMKVNDAAKDKAAVERVNDTAIISTKQDERNAAISAAPPSSTGAATRAANCVRWTQQHPGRTDRPAGC